MDSSQIGFMATFIYYLQNARPLYNEITTFMYQETQAEADATQRVRKIRVSSMKNRKTRKRHVDMKQIESQLKTSMKQAYQHRNRPMNPQRPLPLIPIKVQYLPQVTPSVN